VTRLRRWLRLAADLSRVAVPSWRWGRAERTEHRGLPTLDQMTNDRLSAESRLRRRDR
jgi:hypothetical protein